MGNLISCLLSQSLLQGINIKCTFLRWAPPHCCRSSYLRAEPFQGTGRNRVPFVQRTVLEGSTTLKEWSILEQIWLTFFKSTSQEKPTMSFVLFRLPSAFQGKTKQRLHFEPLSEFHNVRQRVSLALSEHSLCAVSKVKCYMRIILFNSPNKSIK